MKGILRLIDWQRPILTRFGQGPKELGFLFISTSLTNDTLFILQKITRAVIQNQSKRKVQIKLTKFVSSCPNYVWLISSCPISARGNINHTFLYQRNISTSNLRFHLHITAYRSHINHLITKLLVSQIILHKLLQQLFESCILSGKAVRITRPTPVQSPVDI